MSHTTTIQMYASTGGEAAASIDVPDEGELLAVQLEVYSGDINALGDFVHAMLSFGSSSQFTTNDARNVIARAVSGAAGITSGFFRGDGKTLLTYGDGLKVFSGERIYLHTAVNGCTLGHAVALLVFGFKSFQARRR